MILLIDNYDSFSYNLYQLIGTLEEDIKVVRNDQLSLAQIERLKPEAIILSPGPGRPEGAGICTEVVKELGSSCPILGVCLGHQVICEAYGGKVTYAKELMHGKVSQINIFSQSILFKGLPASIPVARYHSLAAAPEHLPEDLAVTAVTNDQVIMAVEHKEYPVYGVQFHPESILTPDGLQIISNFLEGIRHD